MELRSKPRRESEAGIMDSRSHRKALVASTKASSFSSRRGLLRYPFLAMAFAMNGLLFLKPQSNLDNSPESTGRRVNHMESDHVIFNVDVPITRSSVNHMQSDHAINNVAVPKTRGEGALEKLVDELIASWSAQDGISSADRQGFKLSLQDNCFCDLVSRDCLHVIPCRKEDTPQKRQALASIGILLRLAIKGTSQFHNDQEGWRNSVAPIGKLLQYTTMWTWQTWRSTNSFGLYDTQDGNDFIQPDLYPACQSGFKGPSCFFRSPVGSEDSGVIEDEAKRWYKNVTLTTHRTIRHSLQAYLKKHQPRSLSESDHDRVQYDAHFSALGNLMIFAHIARMKFNRRPFLDQIYQDKLTVVPGSKKKRRDNLEDPFIVSLHMRRGDACGNLKTQKYQKEASLLDSKAQVGTPRLCYQTRVYLRALKRIRKLVPKSRPLHVYLATDNVENVLDEILITTQNTTMVDQWHFLNFSRDHFQHKFAVEDQENERNWPLLGETAVTDLWLLSHGHAFVGHLGSRFGKVAWLLATARRNDFVPFFSVDGHSFCCEIDENCSQIKPFITVDNCLAFGHEYNDYENDNYWEEGSQARKKHFLKHFDQRIRIGLIDLQTDHQDQKEGDQAQAEVKRLLAEPDKRITHFLKHFDQRIGPMGIQTVHQAQAEAVETKAEVKSALAEADKALAEVDNLLKE